MKPENKDTFATTKAIKQIISDLRVTRQKTTKITPFEAHFGRPANTPLRNISTSPSSLNLTYEKFFNHYLDADKVPVDDYLDDAGWTNPERSDLDIEKSINRAQQDAGLRYRDSDNKELRFIIHAKLTNPIPRTEKSLNVKLARKLPNKKRAKRQLAGLYEVLKPGSFVIKSSPTTTKINQPGRSSVKVRDSDWQSSAEKQKGLLRSGHMHKDDLSLTNKQQRQRSLSIAMMSRDKRGGKSKFAIAIEIPPLLFRP